MNLITKDTDNLEELPGREKFTDHSRDREHDGFPYKRIRRWIDSCVGRNIDDVIHDFVHLNWVPLQERRASTLRRYIEFDTFLKNNEVYYYTEYGMMHQYNNYNNYVSVKSGCGKTIYVDPVTKMVSVYMGPSAKSKWIELRNKQFEARCRILGDYHQLCKIDGIWYEVKGEVLPPHALGWGYERKNPTDILVEPSFSWQNRNTKIPYVKIVLKRQLSAKELKKHNLQNDKV